MAENLWALLIGVDGYLPNRLPDGGSYPSLNGCVRDINRVHEFLSTRLALPEKQISKLTATNTGEDKPSEPKGERESGPPMKTLWRSSRK